MHFPNLRRLSINRPNFVRFCPYEDDYVSPFSSLEYFEISDKYYRFHLENLKSFILLNPQLKSISLPTDCIRDNFTKFLHTNLPDLVQLRLFSENYIDFNDLERQMKKTRMLQSGRSTIKINFYGNIRNYVFSVINFECLTIKVKTFDETKSEFIESVAELIQTKNIKDILFAFDLRGDNFPFSRAEIEKLISLCKQMKSIVIQCTGIDEVSQNVHEKIVENSADNTKWKIAVNRVKKVVILEKII